MTATDQKLKLIYLARIFEDETDDDHGLTGPQLIEMLAEKGVEVERKTLYRDIDCLRQAGYDIQKYQRSPVEYGLASREFEQPELMLMADAVQSSRFLTKRKSAALVKSIGKLTSKYMSDELKKHVHVEGRIKIQNESVFYHLDAIQRAMDSKRKIEFKYFKYDEHKEPVLQYDGKVYVETPVQLVYMDDCYYVVIWDDRHGDFANFRVDRMVNLHVSSQQATHNDEIANFDVGKYQQRTFGMFNGESVMVTLRVASRAMSAMIDRFGKDVIAIPNGDGTCNVSVTVMDSPTFYGWLAMFGKDVLIVSPASLRESYVEFLQSIVDSYREK